MNALDKYKRVFGEIKTLSESVSWSTGVSNMLEWLLWDTKNILGVTKTKYWKDIIELTNEESIKSLNIEEKQKYISRVLKVQMAESEQLDRYKPPKSSVASPREALRRAKYFSESYLNKEFDIFWTLVSDQFLDAYYGQFTSLIGGGQWSTHGDSGLFGASTGIKDMQMDNLSYNEDEKILIANELKLGGKKNPDQILKYSLMYKLLVERGFIPDGTRFMLLFIGDKLENDTWDAVIDAEIKYCEKSSKSTAKRALDIEGIELARKAEYATTTWLDLTNFNEKYLETLVLPTQQVEQKLIWGFNETLLAKAFIYGCGNYSKA